jgi:hypothetical protein
VLRNRFGNGMVHGIAVSNCPRRFKRPIEIQTDSMKFRGYITLATGPVRPGIAGVFRDFDNIRYIKVTRTLSLGIKIS